MNVYVPLLTFVCVAPVNVIVSIATLSETTAVKVTVCDCELVSKETVVSSALKLVIPGDWSSVFVTVIFNVSLALLPEASITVLSSDLYSSARSLKDELESISRGNTDIIIGTQLIAKGHNFPNLTVVGVVDPDLGLQGSDLRAAERTFQLLRQVSGRAGRNDKRGTAYLQTYQPQHPVIEAITYGQDEQFWIADAKGGELAEMPPFGRLVGILISSQNSEDAFEIGYKLSKKATILSSAGIILYGPAPAPITRVRGRYRVRMLLKASKAVSIQSVIKLWLSGLNLRKDIRLVIDVDPQSFL